MRTQRWEFLLSCIVGVAYKNKNAIKLLLLWFTSVDCRQYKGLLGSVGNASNARFRSGSVLLRERQGTGKNEQFCMFLCVQSNFLASVGMMLLTVNL